MYDLFLLIVIGLRIGWLASDRDRSRWAWIALMVVCWLVGGGVGIVLAPALVGTADPAEDNSFIARSIIIHGAALVGAQVPVVVLALLPPGQSLEDRLDEGMREMGFRPRRPDRR